MVKLVKEAKIQYTEKRKCLEEICSRKRLKSIMISERMKKAAPSATVALSARVTQMREQGIDILNFNMGEPDFDTPRAIIESGIRAMEAGHTRYAPVNGITPLREAIAHKLKQENHVHYEPNQICVSTGAKQAVYNSVMAVCNEGDEVLIPTPCWVSYVEMVKLAGAIPVFVAPGKEYQLNLEEIRAAITEKTKLIIINTPNNPTGACYSQEALEELAQLAAEYDFYILADEVYEKLIFGKEHVSVAALGKEAYEHTITINGFSKAFAMTGWRLGYVAAPLDIAKAVTSLQSNSTTGPTTFVQYAAVTALQECSESVEHMRQEFEKRRDYAYQRLSGMEGITCVKPDGAFYLMPDISAYFGRQAKGKVIRNSVDFCEYILEEARIAVVPGDAFEAPGTIRLAYPASMEQIQEGLDRLERALQKLN